MNLSKEGGERQQGALGSGAQSMLIDLMGSTTQLQPMWTFVNKDLVFLHHSVLQKKPENTNFTVKLSG